MKINQMCLNSNELLDCVLAFAVGAAKTDSNDLLDAFAAERARLVDGVAIFVVQVDFSQVGLDVLGELFGAIAAADANCNRFFGINGFAADRTLVVGGASGFFLCKSISSQDQNGRGGNRENSFHNNNLCLI